MTLATVPKRYKPASGDVVTDGNTSRRIIAILGGKVIYTLGGTHRACKVQSFRQWCRRCGATFMHRGGQ